YAFFASLPALPVLLLASRTGRAAFAGTVYGLSLVALFGVSTLFHRVTWSAGTRRWLGRLDHAMINVLVAGTFTPCALLVLSGPGPCGVRLPRGVPLSRGRGRRHALCGRRPLRAAARLNGARSRPHCRRSRIRKNRSSALVYG